jgi:hypothetical protein
MARRRRKTQRTTRIRKASVVSTNAGEYYHAADQAKMEFLLVCQQELLQEAHEGFVPASAFARFLFEYCEERPQIQGPNCIHNKHNEFSELPVELQLAFVDRLCPPDQEEKLDCLSQLKEEEDEEPLVSEWELFGVCYSAFNNIVSSGLLIAHDSDIAYTDDHDEEVESDQKSKRKKEKSMMRSMQTSAPTISTLPSSSRMPSRSPSMNSLIFPSSSAIPSVSPSSPTTLLPKAPSNLNPQQPSLSATPSDASGGFPARPIPPAHHPASSSLSGQPTTQLPNRTASPVLILPIPPDQSIEAQSQSNLSAAGVAGITAAALILPSFLIFAILRYRSNRSRYSTVRDIHLGESHSILSEDSDFLDGCYAMSPPSRPPSATDSQFNPPIQEISPRSMHSIDNPVAPATFLGSGKMPPPLVIRPVPLGSGDMADTVPSATTPDPLPSLPTSGLGRMSPINSTVDEPYTDAPGEENAPVEQVEPLVSGATSSPTSETWSGYMGPVKRISLDH